jgi:hypothetical protein
MKADKDKFDALLGGLIAECPRFGFSNLRNHDPQAEGVCRLFPHSGA